MLAKRLLQLNLIVSSLIAFTFILLPGPTLALYGISNDSSTRFIAEYFGTTHVAFAVLVWFALSRPASELPKAVVHSFFAGEVAGTLVLLLAQLRGIMNTLGWGFVGLSLLFTVGWGYCIVKGVPKSA